ncbi:MAG: hypothetical protein JXQ90_20005 [Cyclobacteriaceae bacterium]
MSLFVLILLTACGGDDEPISKGAFETGAFVINEGSFGASDGSISHFDDDDTHAAAIFNSVNGGRILGDVIQDLHFDGEKAFILSNNSHKVEVVNAYTFESLYTLDSSTVAYPRYMTSHNGKGYITEWVSFVATGRVSIINLESGELLNQIEVGYGPDGIIKAGNTLYVANGWSNTVSIINMDTETVTETVAVGPGPGQMIRDQGGNIWVACAGGYKEDWSPANDGQLVRINSANEVDHIEELGVNISTKIASDVTGVHIFYSAGNTVFKYNVGAPGTTVPVEFVTVSDAVGIYGLGVDKFDWIYVADNQGFQANGIIHVYDEDRVERKTLTAGRGPNGVEFRY